jgi:hypothetical protein
LIEVYIVEKLENNTLGMGMHRIVEQMGKNDLENWVKIITPETWLIATSN